MGNDIDFDTITMKTWPGDWDMHLVKGFKACMKDKNDDKEVAFNSAVFESERFSSAECDLLVKAAVKLTFKFRDYMWIGTFKFDGTYVIGDIDYVISIVPVEGIEKDLKVYPGGNLVKVYKIPVKTLLMKDVLSTIKETEAIILEDYWRRGKGNDGDNEGDPAPISPESLIKV